MNPDELPNKSAETAVLWVSSVPLWMITTGLALLCPLWVALIGIGIAVFFTASAVWLSIAQIHREWNEWLEQRRGRNE